MKKLTQDKVKELFNYDPITGVISWKKPENKKSWKKNNNYLPDEANAVDYIIIGVFGHRYKAEQLIWLYHYGYIPKSIIDHLNGIRNDNRISNLREVTKGENCRNNGLSRANNSGIRGVTWNRKTHNWSAYICFKNKRIHLVCTKDFQKAVRFRLAAERLFDWNSFKHQSSAYKFINR